MATHVRPNLENKPLHAYINDPKLDQYARKAAELLTFFPQLKVWEVQYKPEGMADTAWYVGFASKEDPYVMNFKIIPSNINVEFRFSQYLSENVFGLLKWQNTSWRYADYKKFGLNEVRSMIGQYLSNIHDDFDNGKLKQGGRSFAEKMIQKALSDIFPGAEILSNIRPDVLRSSLNKPLELDIFLPQMNFAIEIQGPQHFKNVYGSNARLKENDQTKKEWCARNGVRLIWMNWEGINQDILRLGFNDRVDKIKKLVDAFLLSEHHFMWWVNDNEKYLV